MSDQRSYGDIIDLSLQSSISCRCHNYHIADQGALFSRVLLGSSPSLHLHKVPSQPVTAAGSLYSRPKGGTRATGNWYLFPHLHYHTYFYPFYNSRLSFLFLTILLLPLFSFPQDNLLFIFSPASVLPTQCFSFFFSTQSYHLLWS